MFGFHKSRLKVQFSIVALVAFSASPMFGQTTLEQQLEGKSTLKGVMSVVDEYYKGKPLDWRGEEGHDRRIKHWKRWEWYLSSRLGENDEFVNIPERLMKADVQVEKMDTFQLRNVNDFWQTEGPVSTNTVGIGRADRIAFHPSNPNIFYIGTPAGGLWKTTDGGNSWTPLTDNFPSMGISGIIVSHDNPNKIFILTGDADSEYIGGFVQQFGYTRPTQGVYRSLNGGSTWAKMSDIDDGDFLAFKMVQHPLNADIMLIASSQGMYRSTNGGSSWTKTKTGEYNDVEFLPGSSTAVAAGPTEAIYSLFGGNSWQTSQTS